MAFPSHQSSVRYIVDEILRRKRLAKIDEKNQDKTAE
jgi:hypothetical protein